MKTVPRLDGVRILVIEDHADLCELFAVLLRAEGAEVTKAATGHEALTHCETLPFDVILCDLGLPDIPGERLIRHLLATSPGPPVVGVITGGGELQRRRAICAGATAAFLKPVEWERVLAFLRGFEPRHGRVRDLAS